MSKTLSSRMSKAAAVAAIAVAVSLAATASGFAATHRSAHAAHAQSYYDYVPAQSDYTAGQIGRRTDPVLVPPGGYGPPDPASCGGFHC